MRQKFYLIVKRIGAQACRHSLCALLLFTLFAHDLQADDLYDGLYNRPTYFPQWSQPTDWPNTMYYFTCARKGANGERLTNFEVAVYDQNNVLRHCSRSIASQNNLCTLTIPGKDGDTFHFKVIYGDFVNPTIEDAAETCTFTSNDLQGSLNAPFWLTLPLKGDVNNDGEVTIEDLPLLVDMLNGNTPVNAAADVNGDTVVNASDVSALSEIILGK